MFVIAEIQFVHTSVNASELQRHVIEEFENRNLKCLGHKFVDMTFDVFELEQVLKYEKELAKCNKKYLGGKGVSGGEGGREH